MGCLLVAMIALFSLSAHASHTYTVDQSSGSLSAIAQELYGHSKHWKKIAAWNGLAPPYRIHPGQKLQLQERPKKRSERVRAEGATAPANPWLQAPVGRMLEGDVYTVNERAPSLSMVALELYGDSRYTRGLIRENQLQPPYRLQLGQKLRIPLEPKHDSDRGTQALIQEWTKLANSNMVRRLSATLAPEGEVYSAMEGESQPPQPHGPQDAVEPVESAARAEPAGPEPDSSANKWSESEAETVQSPSAPVEHLSPSPTESPLLDFPQSVEGWKDEAPLALSLGASFHFHRLDVQDTANGGRGVLLSDAMPGLEARLLPRLGENTSLLAEATYLRSSFTPNSRHAIAPLRNSTHNLYGFGLGLEQRYGGLSAETMLIYQRDLFALGRLGSFGVDLVPVYSPQLAFRLGWTARHGRDNELSVLAMGRVLLPANQRGVSLGTGFLAGAGLGWRRLMDTGAFQSRILYTRKQQRAGYRHGEQALSLLLGFEWMQP
jgi:hypothetical protein